MKGITPKILESIKKMWFKALPLIPYKEREIKAIVHVKGHVVNFEELDRTYGCILDILVEVNGHMWLGFGDDMDVYDYLHSDGKEHMDTFVENVRLEIMFGDYVVDILKIYGITSHNRQNEISQKMFESKFGFAISVQPTSEYPQFKYNIKVVPGPKSKVFEKKKGWINKILDWV
jgi:hypothetical protein